MEMDTIRKTSKLFVISLFFVIVSFSVGCEPQEKYERSVDLLKPAGNSEIIEATTLNGDIIYNGNETGDFGGIAKIQARARTKEIAQRLADETKVSFEDVENKVVVKIEKPVVGEYESVSVSLDIAGPKAMSVVFESKNGDIVVKQIDKNMTAKTKNGDINGCCIGLYVIAESKNGDIKLNQVGKDITAQTKNGDIRVQDIGGNSNLVTKNGDINLFYKPEATEVSNISVVSKNGSIELRAPRWNSVQVQLVSENGDIDSQFPVQFRGKLRGSGEWLIGDGKNKLNISTTNGDIKIY